MCSNIEQLDKTCTFACTDTEITVTSFVMSELLVTIDGLGNAKYDLMIKVLDKKNYSSVWATLYMAASIMWLMQAMQQSVCSCHTNKILHVTAR